MPTGSSPEGATSPPVWRPAATSPEEFRENAGRLGYVRALAANPPEGPNPNLIAFGNEGGILGMGVCWWHSRFTRAALYLAWFDPGGERPDARGARSMIAAVMAADRVVRIPGYANLREFSLENRPVLQRFLERMQLCDGILRFQWMNGLAGRTRIAPDAMNRLVDGIRGEVSSRGLAWVKLKNSRYDAHSWIVTGRESLPDGRDRFTYLDSNTPGREGVWIHSPGEDSISIPGAGFFGVPYMQRRGELSRILAVAASARGSAGSPGGP